MAAHDDVLHLQRFDRKFQHRQQIHVAGVDDVADIAVHEHFAGIETDDVVGGNAAVRTAEPEIARRLLLGETAKVIGIAAGLARRPGHIAVEQLVDHLMSRSGAGDAKDHSVRIHEQPPPPPQVQPAWAGGSGASSFFSDQLTM